VVTGLADGHLTRLVTLDQNHTLGPDRLVLHQLHERVEVSLRRVH
jgi:hypothetical protein